MAAALQLLERRHLFVFPHVIFLSSLVPKIRHSRAPYLFLPSPDKKETKQRTAQVWQSSSCTMPRHTRATPAIHFPALPIRVPRPSPIFHAPVCSPAPAGQSHPDSAHPVQKLTNQVTSVCLSLPHTPASAACSRLNKTDNTDTHTHTHRHTTARPHFPTLENRCRHAPGGFRDPVSLRALSARHRSSPSARCRRLSRDL